MAINSVEFSFLSEFDQRLQGMCSTYVTTSVIRAFASCLAPEASDTVVLIFQNTDLLPIGKTIEYQGLNFALF